MRLGWVDFTEDDKKRLLNVLEHFKDEGAVDELGIGVVRDGFSNYFFPGTSTLHTKAKYLFIVSYILKDLESSDEKNFRALRKELDKLEETCAREMLDRIKSQGGDARGSGIVGSNALPKSWVARTPSIMYWAALQRYGFIRNSTRYSSLGINECLKILSSKKTVSIESYGYSKGDEDSDFGDDRQYDYSVINIPQDGYLNWKADRSSIELNSSEASFLKEKIITRCPNTLLSFALENLDKLPFLEDMEASFEGFSCTSSFSSLPENIKETYVTAYAFSQLVYGLRIRYNITLQEKQEYLNEWDNYEVHLLPLALKLDVDAVWRILRIGNNPRDNRTRTFLKDAQMLLARRDLDDLDALITIREERLKGQARAKIGHPERYRDLWYGGRILNYRFPFAQNMIKEIAVAEAGGKHA